MTDLTTLSEKTMIESGQATTEMLILLKTLAQSNANIIIGGQCNSGKSTLLRWYVGELPKTNRIVVSDFGSQLQSKVHYPDRFIQDITNIRETDPIPLKKALSRTPNYVIVDELKPPINEKLFLQLLLTGIHGAATIHGSNTIHVMNHLLSNAILQLNPANKTALGKTIAQLIDVVVIQKSIPEKSKVISEIVEIVGFENDHFITKTLYESNLNQ